MMVLLGIEEADNVPSARVAVQGRRIVLLADEPLQASLYAVDGRLLGSGRVFTAPSAGVYLLRCSDGQVVKVPVE